MRLLIIALLAVTTVALIGCSSEQTTVTGAEKPLNGPSTNRDGALDYEPEFGIFGTVPIHEHELPQYVWPYCEECNEWVGAASTMVDETGEYVVDFTEEEAENHNGHPMRAVWFWPGGSDEKAFTFEAPVTGPIDF